MYRIVSIYYHWGKYTLSSYDELMEHVKTEGKADIETIEKVFISEDEYKTVARFYYVRNG
jgi:hypothetical protein